MDTQQAKFEGWAIVDVLGHQRYVGHVTTQAFGAAVLFRIDVPELPERERITTRPGWVNDGYAPAGSVTRESSVPGYTKLVGAGSIYTITPCTQEAAMKALEESQVRPLILVSMPPDTSKGELPPADPCLADDDDADDFEKGGR